MSTIWQLCEPIVDNGIKNTNFFNGRLLASEDLQVEQQAQRQRETFLGQALGPGVIQGLQVSLQDSVDSPLKEAINSTLLIQAGMAINASGQVLSLPQTVQVTASQQPAFATASGSAFGACSTEQFLPTNIGIYLLVLSPASDYRGSAPYSGLGKGGQISGCGKRFEMEGVQFRMVKVTLDEALGVDQADAAEVKTLVKATNLAQQTALPADDTAKLSRLRSRLASLFLGGATAAGFAADPSRQQVVDETVRSAYECYGLLERMMAEASKPVGPDDVPLALVYWTSRGVRFVDNWSVRRRTAQAFQQGPWGYALGGRRTREGEAMLLQFQEQLQDLLDGTNGFSSVTPGKLTAQDHFVWLPPAGLLPVAETGGQKGIQLDVFLAGMKVRDLSKDPLFIEGAGLNGLLREALAYPPVDPNGQELVWIYHVRENEQPVTPPPRYLAFANGHIPYRGQARFDLNYLDYANFS